MMIKLKKFEEICSKFNEKRVLIFGDIILDRYIFGNVSRISPEAPVPVVKITKEEYRPGGAGNVAANIDKLGGDLPPEFTAETVGFVIKNILKSLPVFTVSSMFHMGELVKAIISATVYTAIASVGILQGFMSWIMEEEMGKAMKPQVSKRGYRERY